MEPLGRATSAPGSNTKINTKAIAYFSDEGTEFRPSIHSNP